jgi:hypothetical protein
VRVASLVLGIVGGVIGVLAGLLVLLFGGIGAAFEADETGMILGSGFSAALLGVAGIVGGALAPRYPVVAAVVQALSGLLGFVAVSMFWLLSGPLLLIGALLAVPGRLAGPTARG